MFKNWHNSDAAAYIRLCFAEQDLAVSASRVASIVGILIEALDQPGGFALLRAAIACSEFYGLAGRSRMTLLASGCCSSSLASAC